MTNDAATKRWELGSEFHWIGLAEPPMLRWPANAVWYALGRHASWASKTSRKKSTENLVANVFLSGNCRFFISLDCDICEYRDDPRWPEPDWNSLNPAQNDVVLAVNYFGVRSSAPWERWRQRVSCVLLEDHSQDPFSPWALGSSADYCFASLRKLCPFRMGQYSGRRVSLHCLNNCTPVIGEAVPQNWPQCFTKLNTCEEQAMPASRTLSVLFKRKASNI